MDRRKMIGALSIVMVVVFIFGGKSIFTRSIEKSTEKETMLLRRLESHKESLETITKKEEVIKVSNGSDSYEKRIHLIKREEDILEIERIKSWYIIYEIDNTLEKAYILIEGKKYEPLEKFEQESEERKTTYLGIDYFDLPHIKIVLPEELYVKFDL